MTLTEWIGRNIFIRLTFNNLVFSGKVLDVIYVGKDITDNEIYLFTIRDKFGKLQTFSSKEIALIQEQEPR